MRTTPRLLAAALVLATAATVRAEVIEASATTVVSAGQQLRGALTGVTPELDTVVPVFELLSLQAHELRNPVFQNLEVVVAGWASYDAAEPRWNSGSTSSVTGDLTTGYVRGQLFNRALTLRVGRSYVATGVGRMLQIDGADLLLRVPGGLSLSAFGGLPVAQRFSTRAGEKSWNPAGGDKAYGGRLGWTLPLPGASGRALDIGASYLTVTDAPLTVKDPTDPAGLRTITDGGGNAVRQDAGVDVRLQPMAGLVLTGNGTYSMSAGRLAEIGVMALYTATKTVFVTADFKKLAPDLFLSQNSILSVFTDKERTDVGGGVRWQASHATSLGLDYHLLVEPTGEANKTELGHEAAARVEWEDRATRAGGELTYLVAGTMGPETNGYVGARAYGRRELGKAFLTADVMVNSFKQEINGTKLAVTGTLSAGYALGGGWSTVLAGRAGVTPFLEQQADLLVKLVYNQITRVREVK
jgi:hypothetical protein